MNKQDRQNKQWDEAAEQCKVEGVSSFGRMCKGWTSTQRTDYAQAACDRGLKFEVDEDGVGYFTE